MKLPNAGGAVIDERKVRDYLLSKAHPIGRFKASFFARAGFDVEHWAALISQLRQLALRGEATLGEKNEHDQKYLISGTLVRPRGVGLEDAPRLVTVYPRQS